MSKPTQASVDVHVDAPPSVVYDLIADVTRMGEWSPECQRCEWLGPAGEVGSRFRGHNRRGPARWSTTAEVLAADPPNVFSFATLYRGKPATKWTYALSETADGGTRLEESFNALAVPWLIGVAESLFVRNRQEQLEEDIASTLAAIKRVAEA